MVWKRTQHISGDALDVNPWSWITPAGLNYLVEDREKIYSGTSFYDLPYLTVE